METETHKCSKETYIAVVQVAKQLKCFLRASILFILSRSRISRCFAHASNSSMFAFASSICCIFAMQFSSTNLVASSIILRKFPMASA